MSRTKPAARPRPRRFRTCSRVGPRAMPGLLPGTVAWNGRGTQLYPSPPRHADVRTPPGNWPDARFGRRNFERRYQIAAEAPTISTFLLPSAVSPAVASPPLPPRPSPRVPAAPADFASPRAAYAPHLGATLPYYPRGRSDLSPRFDTHFQPGGTGGTGGTTGLSPGTRYGWFTGSGQGGGVW